MHTNINTANCKFSTYKSSLFGVLFLSEPVSLIRNSSLWKLTGKRCIILCIYVVFMTLSFAVWRTLFSAHSSAIASHCYFLKCMLRLETVQTLATELLLFSVIFCCCCCCSFFNCITHISTYLPSMCLALYEIVTKWTHSFYNKCMNSLNIYSFNLIKSEFLFFNFTQSIKCVSTSVGSLLFCLFRCVFCHIFFTNSQSK